MTGLCDPVLWL